MHLKFFQLLLKFVHEVIFKNITRYRTITDSYTYFFELSFAIL
jgi:hypothetical protein